MLAAALGALALFAPAAAFLPQQQHARPALPVPALAAKKKSGGGGGGGGGGRRAPVDKALQTALETWEPVIGIEIHTQLLTASKAYCSCPVQRGLDVAPNTYVCPVCMAEPGALPTVNSKVLELACKAGMALGCEIAERCKYDRKNYFYPDTPKNYQITQYDEPVAARGSITLPSGAVVRIERLHMEEDSAKMNHQGAASLIGSTHSLIDFNRAGVPLAEIVTEPDIHSAEDAAAYGRELQKILRCVGASDGNMAEGSLRMDVNVSIRKKGETGLNTKTEVKNLNSFKSAQSAVEYEVKRQAALFQAGERVRSETRTWDEKELSTKVMRVKEGLADYRYFPEPDIPPFALDRADVERWRLEIPELPAAKRTRFAADYAVDAATALILTDEADVAEFFERCVASGADAVETAKWITGDVAGLLKTSKDVTSLAASKLTPEALGELILLLDAGRVTGRTAKDVLPALLFEHDGTVVALIEALDLFAITDVAAIEALVQAAMDANPDKVEQFRGGKTKLAGFFLGAAMTASGGRAEPKVLNESVQRLLAVRGGAFVPAPPPAAPAAPPPPLEAHRGRRDALAALGAAAAAATAAPGPGAAATADFDPQKVNAINKPLTASDGLVDPRAAPPKVTQRCWLDVTVGGEPAGRLDVAVWGEVSPAPAANFVSLCAGDKAYSYAGTRVDRVVKGLNIQGGDASKKLPAGACVKSGSCVSAEGPPLVGEVPRLLHTLPYIVSFQRGLDGAIDSRFFITLPEDARWASSRYVGVGAVEKTAKSQALLERIEALDVTQPANTPNVPVVFVASGVY